MKATEDTGPGINKGDGEAVGGTNNKPVAGAGGDETIAVFYPHQLIAHLFLIGLIGNPDVGTMDLIGED